MNQRGPASGLTSDAWFASIFLPMVGLMTKSATHTTHASATVEAKGQPAPAEGTRVTVMLTHFLS